jgi:drug/metabolite transporter (DMT)-like permease
MPWVFVLIWSTGFVVARYGMPHAPPMHFLALRFALSVLCFAAWVMLAGAAWPKGRQQWMHHAVAGALMHAGYLGGVWAAVRQGIGAGTVALIVGLQPVLTALWLSALARGAAPAANAAAVSRTQWAGLGLGLAGLSMVVWHKLGAGEVTALNLGLALFALLAITAGTLYQKRHMAPCDVRAAGAVQLGAAFVVTLPLALLEPGSADWTHPHLLGALAWSVVVLTLGGSSLLYLLIQRGAATRVSSLMYLVPPCTALLAWALFGESFTTLMLLGMLCVVSGVAMVVRQPARQSAPTRPPETNP